MDKADLFDAIAAVAADTEPALAGAYVTRVVLLAELALPEGGLAFHRMTSTADGRALPSWDVDGMLVTAFREGRKPLGPLAEG